jgi:type IV secretory pathway VirB3-like protein
VTVPSDNGIQRYQIALWVSVALVLTIAAAVYSLAYMSFKKDSMLYSSFNPRWEDKKHR